MILTLIGLITSIVGIIGFCIGNSTMLIISGVFYIFETVIGLMTGELKNISTTILTIIISLIISNINSYNILLGICFGLSIESLLFSALGLIFVMKYIK